MNGKTIEPQEGGEFANVSLTSELNLTPKTVSCTSQSYGDVFTTNIASNLKRGMLSECIST